MSETVDVGCEQALKRLVEFVDHELPETEHDSVEQHLRICRNCCSRMEFERRLKEREFLAILRRDTQGAKTETTVA